MSTGAHPWRRASCTHHQQHALLFTHYWNILRTTRTTCGQTCDDNRSDHRSFDDGSRIGLEKLMSSATALRLRRSISHLFDVAYHGQQRPDRNLSPAISQPSAQVRPTSATAQHAHTIRRSARNAIMLHSTIRALNEQCDAAGCSASRVVVTCEHTFC